MSDWVHCNSCFRQPGDGCKYSLTNCGHIYCEHCVHTDAKDKCKLCGNKCTTILLTTKMKPDVEKFFCDPSELVKRYQNEVVQVIDFQKSHRQRLSTFIRQKMTKQNAMMQRAQRGVEQCRDMEREIQVVREENAYLKKLISNMGGPQSGSRAPGKVHGGVILSQRSQGHVSSPVGAGSPAYGSQRSQTARPTASGDFCSSQRSHYSKSPYGDSRQSPQNTTPQGKRLSVRPPPSQGRIGSMTPSPIPSPGRTPGPQQGSERRDMSPMSCSPAPSHRLAASGSTPGVPITGGCTPGWRSSQSLNMFATPGSQSTKGFGETR